MKTKIITASAAAAIPFLDTLTREELSATAKATGIKVGKSKANTIANLTQAVREGKVHFKSHGTLSVNPAKQGESSKRITYFGKTLRTYVSGPGQGNVTWLTPAAPVAGSPSPRY